MGRRFSDDRFQIVRQDAKPRRQRGRDFHEIQLAIDQDRMEVSIIEGAVAKALRKLLFDLSIECFSQPFAIARHARSDPSMPVLLKRWD